MNKQKKQNYSVGLTVSPSSVGYAAIDDQMHLIQPVKAHHKNAIGVRKFGEGETAADTRMARSARRNLRRKKSRITYLNQTLAPLINEVDPLMFARLKQSGLSPLDSNKKYRSQIFDKPNIAAYYHKKFPTVYHLEKYLMTTNDKADIRLVYEALHTLLTNRGQLL
jgi:CRISPR-associated endonuclease Csn1